jgi:hypothetical protein
MRKGPRIDRAVQASSEGECAEGGEETMTESPSADEKWEWIVIVSIVIVAGMLGWIPFMILIGKLFPW